MITDRQIPETLKRKIRILVVEDNLLNQKLAAFMLDDWGFHYDLALNGKAALDLLKEKEYDLILMDIIMPEMNGYETTHYIREKMKLGIPIIATTSNASEHEREKCLSEGMTDYLTKPIRSVQLYNLVTNYLFTTVVENVDNRQPGNSGAQQGDEKRS
jgi:CheY-like chemotaxis protein